MAMALRIELHVRVAGPADAEAVVVLNRDVQALHAALEPALFKPPGPSTMSVEDAIAILALPQNLVLLAEVDGTPVGYAYAELRRRGETPFAYAYDEMYLHHLSVAPSWRRRGVGQALLAAVSERASVTGIGRVALDVWSANTAARAFFESQGFAPYNERMARGGWQTSKRAVLSDDPPRSDTNST